MTHRLDQPFNAGVPPLSQSDRVGVFFTLTIALLLAALPAHAQKTEAAAAAKAQQWPQAVTLYKQVVDKDPSDGASWYELGSAALQANDSHTAVTAFEHSLALKVRPAFSSYNLACAHARLGEKDKAL